MRRSLAVTLAVTVLPATALADKPKKPASTRLELLSALAGSSRSVASSSGNSSGPAGRPSGCAAGTWWS